MTADTVYMVSQEAMLVAIKLAGPILLASLAVFAAVLVIIRYQDRP